jgi:ubiquinol oxidase
MKFLTHVFNPVIFYFFKLVVFVFDKFYGYQDYRRFYVLESIARVPYFAYLSVLHMYQTFGRHPGIELLDLHYKESVNEAYHLAIMEELRGNEFWYDRWLAKLLGVAYYWATAILYLLTPSSGYYLMQQVEQEAASSYDKFIDLHKTKLVSQGLGLAAKKYYFSKRARMTPPVNKDEPTMLDVFKAIRDDELVHVEDMRSCEQMPSLYSEHPGVEQ